MPKFRERRKISRRQGKERIVPLPGKSIYSIRPSPAGKRKGGSGLQKRKTGERRSGEDRRSGKERRIKKGVPLGKERRSGKERRALAKQ